MTDPATIRLAERNMTRARILSQATRRPVAAPLPLPAPGTCQALSTGPDYPFRNLTTGRPDLDWYDPCTSPASRTVTATCPHGHQTSWRACEPCAQIIAAQFTRSHPHCPGCRKNGSAQPADLTITPPGTPIATGPGTGTGCRYPDCPQHGLSWACHRCGDAYFSTPPDHGLCLACTYHICPSCGADWDKTGDCEHVG